MPVGARLPDGVRRLPVKRVALVVALLGAACTQAPEPSTTEATQQVLNRGNGSEPESLDPHQARTDSAGNIVRDLFEGLTVYSRDGRVEAGTAESWDVSADGKVYTFRIREGARWSNGDPVTAFDFLTSFRRLADPDTRSPYTISLETVQNARAIIAGELPPEELGVEAPDPNTLIIHLDSPTPYLLSLFTHWSTVPIHAPSLERHGDEFVRPENMVSNGAFVLAEWVTGSHVTAIRNPAYWRDEENAIDVVHYYHITNDVAELNRYRAGELDFTFIVPAERFEWVKTHLDDELHIAPQITTYYYGFNLAGPPFRDNLMLRKALSMVVDREQLTAKVTGRGEIPAYGWVPPGVNNYTPQHFDYKDMSSEERIAEARRLYALAGYSEDNPAVIELRYNPEHVHAKIAAAVSAMWKTNLGVETELVGREMRVLIEDMRTGNTEAFRSSWVGDYDDAYTFAQVLLSDSSVNFPRYENPEYDRLLREATVEVDLDSRRRLLEEAERLMLEDHPIMPLYFYVNKHLVKPYVQGWADNILNLNYSRHLTIDRPAQ